MLPTGGHQDGQGPDVGGALGDSGQGPLGAPLFNSAQQTRTRAPPITQSLHPRIMERVVSTLFPTDDNDDGPLPGDRPYEEVDPGAPQVTREELTRAVKRMGVKNMALGPDGIPGKAWTLAMSALGDQLRRLFTACLETGRFPPEWRTARLVLLKKEGRPEESPSAYCPICLLDEVGKLFERIIHARLVEHLRTAGPGLSEKQYGFREGRSTIDAIQCVKAFSENTVARGEVAVAVSLDIANAFNTLPWARIWEALEFFQVPPYLRRIVGAYLKDREIIFPGRYGVCRRGIESGVPQGSVLGPLLWNVGYDKVLKGALLTGMNVVSAADDTLVMARGEDWVEAASRASAGVTLLVSRIERLRLRVALDKTEVTWAPSQAARRYV